MKKSCLALAALLGFSAYTVFTMLTAHQSLAAFGLELMASPDTAQVVIDLYLMAVLACVWMYRDARGKGRSLASVLPYLLLTAVFVAIGPLLYIVVEGFVRNPGTNSRACLKTPRQP
ncbi:MAG: DUF2834 domain-containing protein [Pseudomonas sp.]|uniref:DUF2834 domain-containing protein n=1 Tax=Pseudomonas sp. TaxID=306 RepID=UPI001B585B7C|nr:DUF2834 domain-containing protein [Pseudomonas sp.]MBP3860636.1 DUF2834 domain-containing protein [Pseudomonas sp.]MDN5406003.1 DUF2834 domain-containing protein [Pseudomonas sp.]MDN5453705.1 DUF2834 domain-containing protein [Pseudomonas sp.]MDN5457460.1 DUF2834 domain-containing protein [Pseudomonas sp.]